MVGYRSTGASNQPPPPPPPLLSCRLVVVVEAKMVVEIGQDGGQACHLLKAVPGHHHTTTVPTAHTPTPRSSASRTHRPSLPQAGLFPLDKMCRHKGEGEQTRYLYARQQASSPLLYPPLSHLCRSRAN